MTCSAGKRGPQSHTITALVPGRPAGIPNRRPETTVRHDVNTAPGHTAGNPSQPRLDKPTGGEKEALR